MKAMTVSHAGNGSKKFSNFFYSLETRFWVSNKQNYEHMHFNIQHFNR